MTMSGDVHLERLGVVMEPDKSEPLEAWGVLNPALATRDGETWLFPRLVAEGNESRVGRARVVFGPDGTPTGVERNGTVLAPDESWERNARTGGVEDPRITEIAALGLYAMTYASYGPLGPRAALAASTDLVTWQRLGPVLFDYEPGLDVDFNLYLNKDALLFPEVVTAPDGRPAFAMLHRPTWDLSHVAEGEGSPLPTSATDPRPGIWISYAPVDDVGGEARRLVKFGQHRQVAVPKYDWEDTKIGGGPPPVRTHDGWFLIHHGVTGSIEPGTDHQKGVRYCAGWMVLDADDPSQVVGRSETPILEPQLEQEQDGIVANVVFPTAIDVRGDDEAHVYYGMADSRIGVARLTGVDFHGDCGDAR